MKRRIIAWTYTHAWREVPAKIWRGISILASCDTLQDIPLARAQGYATAFVARKGTGLYELFKRVPRTAVDAEYGKLIPCPYQVSPKKPQCVDCRLCFNTKFLKKTKSTIVFLEH